MSDDSSNAALNDIEAELAGLTNEGGESQEVDAKGKSEVGGHESRSESRDANLNLILDIPLRVTVELGRTKMVVSELLNLGQGSVIELSKLAGEPMEVLVNDKLVARGEAVVVNEKFGVRLTDIISPTERVEQLGS
ncbi:MAG: flagellar motor switch protein FliN [Bdellovibrionales bacterium]|nr:flagellar motor switch protein FliN [Bdellovibrionales bacterium]